MMRINSVELLTLLLAGLKITHKIDWTWLQVITPVLVWFAFCAIATSALLLLGAFRRHK